MSYYSPTKKKEKFCDEDMSLIKTRLLDTALTLYQKFSGEQDPSENLTSSQFKALKRLSKNPKHRNLESR